LRRHRSAATCDRGFRTDPGSVFIELCHLWERIPIADDHRQQPFNPYGRSKLFVERMLADLNGASGLTWVALRYFIAAGADPKGKIGEGTTLKLTSFP
jgi:UDP-glucose 4-epimerase